MSLVQRPRHTRRQLRSTLAASRLVIGPSVRVRRTELVRTRSKSRPGSGQALVEFAIVLPLFLYLVMSLIEFMFVFNGVNGLNYATRNAALIAAEAGNQDGADCAVLRQVETDVSAPMIPASIQTVQIFRANRVGDPYGSQTQVYARTGSTTCTIEGTTFTVPYSVTAAGSGYAPASRCNLVKGCPSLGRTELDTIGVRIDYVYTPHVPMMVPWLGLFLTIQDRQYILSRSNVMRMEPVL
jgi:Flp pilus assembly protein TadG